MPEPSRTTSSLTSRRQTEHAMRDKRLANALRENLRRRKEQGRARGGTLPEPTDAPVKPQPPEPKHAN